jgi:hypothetical protein
LQVSNTLAYFLGIINKVKTSQNVSVVGKKLSKDKHTSLLQTALLSREKLFIILTPGNNENAVSSDFSTLRLTVLLQRENNTLLTQTYPS